MSMPIHRRPSAWAASMVVPHPQNGSSTTSPGLDARRDDPLQRAPRASAWGSRGVLRAASSSVWMSVQTSLAPDFVPLLSMSYHSYPYLLTSISPHPTAAPPSRRRRRERLGASSWSHHADLVDIHPFRPLQPQRSYGSIAIEVERPLRPLASRTGCTSCICWNRGLARRRASTIVPDDLVAEIASAPNIAVQEQLQVVARGRVAVQEQSSRSASGPGAVRPGGAPSSRGRPACPSRRASCGTPACVSATCPPASTTSSYAGARLGVPRPTCP